MSFLEEFQWVSVLLQGLYNCLSCITFQWNNFKNFSIWCWNLISTLDYIAKGILQRNILNTLHTPGVNFKGISELREF